jgi:hypothetical protein
MTRPSFGKLLKYALFHPWHVVALAGSTVFGVAAWSLTRLFTVFGAVEAIMVLVVLLMPFFRRYVQEEEEGKATRKAEEERAKVISELFTSQQDTYQRLYNSVKKTEKRLASLGLPCQMEECWHLLSVYLETAKRYVVVSSYSTSNISDLQEKLSYLRERTPSELNQERCRLLQERIDLIRSSCQNETDYLSELLYLEDLIGYRLDKINLFHAPPVDFKYRVSSKVSTELSVVRETLAEMEEFAHIQAEGAK